jgi:hypothetical protein
VPDGSWVAGGVGAVDDAVVVGQREVGHRPDIDLECVVDARGDNTVDDRPGTQNRRLGLVDDRGIEQRPTTAGVGDREVPPKRSSGRMVFDRTRSAESAMAWAIWGMLAAAALRITGTIKPISLSTAMPRCTAPR